MFVCSIYELWNKTLEEKLIFQSITELQNYRIKWFSLSPGGLYTACENTPLLNISQFVPLIRDTMVRRSDI